MRAKVLVLVLVVATLVFDVLPSLKLETTVFPNQNIPIQFMSLSGADTSKRNPQVSTMENDYLWNAPKEPDPLVWKHLSLAWSIDGIESPTLKNRSHFASIMDGSCPPTAQLRFDTSDRDRWIVSTLDRNGNVKKMGGDEFYIQHHTKRNTAAALITDRHDGTYVLKFVSSPFVNDEFEGNPLKEELPDIPESGILHVHLEYTCNMGRIHQPSKHSWTTGGQIMLNYTVPVRTPPIVHEYERKPSPVDFGKYDNVTLVGDSNIGIMFMAAQTCRVSVDHVPVRRPLSLNSVKKHTFSEIRDHLLANMKPQERRAILLSSNTWDILYGKALGARFERHAEGSKHLVKLLREAFPTVDVFWYAGWALQIHQASMIPWYERPVLRYISYSRSELLYKVQARAMQEANVTFIDTFEASYLSAHLMPTADSRHYSTTFFEAVIRWLYPSKFANRIIL